MEDIKNFLISCGLSKAIPIFERHKIRVDQFDEIGSEDMKELLPALGDRLDLRKAIKRRSGGLSYNRPISKSQKKNEVKCAPTKTIKKNDPEKIAYVAQMLKNERLLAELYEMATNVLIEFSLFSFDGGCRRISPDWTLIDFSDGSLNCLLCKKKIRIQTRAGSGLLWNIGNYKRHYKEEHRNDLSDILETEKTIETNSFLEVLLTDTENETLSTLGGSSSRKRNAPDTFNESISKRLTIVDISSEESNVLNQLDIDTLNKSMAVDSVEGGEYAEDVTEAVDTYQNSISIEHTKSTSVDVRTLFTEVTSTGSKVDQTDATIGNLNENTTDEAATEELKMEKISPSNEAKENHNWSKKAEKTLYGVSEEMVDGIEVGLTTRPNDCTTIRNTDPSSSNGTDFETVTSVVSSESVMTEDIDGNSHHSTCARQQKLALKVVVEDFSEQGTEDVISDVSKQLDTYTEIFATNICSNVIKPDGKTSTCDITIATTTENNEQEEELGPVPEWRKTGVKFGWARKSSISRFYPGFLISNEKFKWITTKAELSRYSFKPLDFNEEINQNQKNEAQIGYLHNFNKIKETSFE